MSSFGGFLLLFTHRFPGGALKIKQKESKMKNTKEKISIQELSDHKEIQDAVHNYMKHRILDVIYRIFNDEVTKLCGPLYDREEECMRNGSDPGSVYAQGQRVSIRKPRVKKDGKDVKLRTYSALRNYDVFTEKIQNHLLHELPLFLRTVNFLLKSP